MAKGDNILLPGQVPLPQVSKEAVERNALKKQLKQAPALTEPLPQVSKEAVERNALKKAAAQPPRLTEAIPDVTKQEAKQAAEQQAYEKQLKQPPRLTESLPQGKRARLFKVLWGGINKSNDLDTGDLTGAGNIDTSELPCLVPCVPMRRLTIAADKWYSRGGGSSERNLFEPYPYIHPTALCAYEDYLVAVYNTPLSGMTSGVYIDVIPFGTNSIDYPILTGVVDAGENDNTHTIAAFNIYENINNPINGNTYRRFIIAPHMRALNIEYGGTVRGSSSDALPNPSASKAGEIWVWNTTGTAYNDYFNFYECVYESGGYRWKEITYGSESALMHRRFFQPSFVTNAPIPDYITVDKSRLFGVANGRVFASGFGDYANWNLDTSTEYNESNAWCSPAQSNTKASTDFTGITSFKNHVICFKRDFIHEVYNNKNPFRLVDVYSEGTIDQRSIQEVNGNLYFVSDNNVLVYTGGTPKIVGKELGIRRFTYAVAGTDNRRYYLYCKDAAGNEHFYVYDTWTRTWGERAIDITVPTGSNNEKVVCFANNNRGLFMLAGDGYIYRLDGDDLDDDFDSGDKSIFANEAWWAETEMITRHNKTTSYTNSAVLYSNNDIKQIKSLQLIADVAPGGGTAPDTYPAARLKLFILYDGEKYNAETSVPVYDSNGETGRVVARIKLRNTAHYSMKIRIQGTGYVKLYELGMYVEDGGTPYLGTGDGMYDG